MTFPFSIFISTSFLLACQSNSSKQPDKKNPVNQYSDIDTIIEKNDATFIDADFVQFLTGDSAIEAAKKEHMADTFTIDGKTHIDVPNDYFVLNESKKIRRLRLSEDVVFELLFGLDKVDPEKEIKDNSLKSFKKVYKEGLFLLTIINDEVVKIKEVFLP